MNDFDEACAAEISREAAHVAITVKHGLPEVDWTMFLADVGDRQTYHGHEVLYWLGY